MLWLYCSTRVHWLMGMYSLPPSTPSLPLVKVLPYVDGTISPSPDSLSMLGLYLQVLVLLRFFVALWGLMHLFISKGWWNCQPPIRHCYNGMWDKTYARNFFPQGGSRVWSWTGWNIEPMWLVLVIVFWGAFSRSKFLWSVNTSKRTLLPSRNYLQVRRAE